MSRFFTSRALSSMNLRRASTSSPISVVKMASVSAMSSSLTESSVRRSGSMVVSQSCVAGHLAQALVALHLVVLLALLHDVGEELARGLLLHRLAQSARRAAGLLGLRVGLRLGAFAFRLSASSAAASRRAFGANSIRNGGSRNSLISVYFDIIWRNSGLDASVQSMQRSAPCESVKQIDQVWCSSSSTGLRDLELELVGQLGQLARAARRASGGTSLPVFDAKSARCVSSARASSSVSFSLRMRLSTFSTKPRYSFSVPMKRVRSAPSMRLAALAVAHDHAFGGAVHHHLHKLAVVLDVLLEAALLDLVERRLRNVDVVALDQLRHVAEEEGEQQRADVRAVHVGVGHEDDLAVADLGGVEVVLADAAAERGDHGADFFVAQHLVVARLLDVEDLALERQDGLEAAIAALLGGAAGALALDQVELAAVGVALAAVGQLAGQAAAVERALAAGQVAGLARRLAGARRFNGLVDDLAWRRADSARGTCPGAR